MLALETLGRRWKVLEHTPSVLVSSPLVDELVLSLGSG